MSEPDALAVALHVITSWPGARVFPVVGKQPAFAALGKDEDGNPIPWDKAATRSVDQVADWFMDTRAYGIGVTGVLAIDSDAPDEGALARATFGAVLDRAVVICGNPAHRTFIYAQPDTPLGDGRWAGGEIKGSGYIVLPPSRHVSSSCPECAAGNHCYRWLSPDGLATPLLPWDGPDLSRPQGEAGEPDPEVAGRWESWLTAGVPCPPVRRAVAELRTGLASGEGFRHPSMLKAQLQVLSLGEKGHRGTAEAYSVVLSAFKAAVGTDPARLRAARSEWERGQRGAIERISSDPTDWLAYGCCPPEEPQEAAGGDGTEEAVFGATPVLSALRGWARASRVGPWALLGCSLATVVAETLPSLTMDGGLGDGTPNLFVALVGESGTGKSRAWSEAHRFVGVSDPQSVRIGHATGEGMIAAFMVPNPDKDEAKVLPYVMRAFPAVLAFVDEIGQLVAANGRNGATGDAVLRSMWSGGQVGSQTADRDRRRSLAANSYRLGLVAGVQPSIATHIIGGDALATGMAQRWLWMPVTDPDAPRELPDRPRGLAWRRPVARGFTNRITYPEAVRRQVTDEAWERATGALVVDPADSHRTYHRLKVAAALALLHGSTDVSQEQWELAGLIMRVSDQTRNGVIRHLSRDAERRVESEGRREAVKVAAFDEARVEAGARRALSILRSHDHDPAGCTRRCLSRGVSKGLRGLLGEIIDKAVASGPVVVDEAPDRQPRYRLVE